MTLVQLEYILAVAEHRNFTLAAEKTFVTQPTLSMQIQKLEKELNIEIFDRSMHPIRLTQIGEKVVEQAQKILKEAHAMKQLVYEEKGLLEGDFLIGVIPTVLPTLVPLFYREFQKTYPKARLIIKELQTNEILSELADGTLDFGLVVTPLNEEQIVEKILYYEPMLAYIPPSHSLYSKEKIGLKDLNIQDILLLKEGHCFRNNVLNLCDSVNLKNQNIRLDSGSLDTLVKLANEGYGMTLLPAMHTEDLAKEYKKNIRYFEEPTPMREVSLIYHQSNMRKSFEESLIKTIQNVMRGKTFTQKIMNVTSPLVNIPA
ncbi:MAG: LysR substrate-binding domain-containing protein [Weeksellaceae bacterium]|nr:LysR substrate-binding domain-containing protein [Weeksellaceae bacterium]